MSIASEAFTAELLGATHSEPWRNGELFVTPWTFRDNEPVILYVEETAAGRYIVSDRGQTADNLTLSGLDLSRKDVARSWAAIQTSVDTSPLVSNESTEGELIARSSRDDLGMAMHQVAEAAIRADGLRALARSRSVSSRFDQWVIRSASAHGLAVVPHAEVRSTVGVTRRVSALLQGSRNAYVQALGPSKDPWEAYDRARSVFMDTSLSRDERFTVVANGSRLSSEQVRGIEQHSSVIMQSDFSNLLRQVA